MTFLATKAPAGDVTASTLEAMRATDLYLVCACMQLLEPALVAFERHYFLVIDRAFGRMKLPSPASDDIKSALRERLFFPKDGRPPLLAGYSGRGDLAAWLRSVAVRAALKSLRARRDVPLEADVLDVAMASDAPDLALLKATFAAAFKVALAEVVQRRSVRDRNLLRQYFVDELNLDELGRFYNVNASTVSRWLARLRDEIFEEVSRTLMNRFGVGKSELRQALRMARSQLDVSIHRILADGN